MRISTKSVLLNVAIVIIAVATVSGFILGRIHAETNRLAGVVQEKPAEYLLGAPQVERNRVQDSRWKTHGR